MNSRNKKITGILLTLLGSAFWGLSGTCGQYLFDYKDVTVKWLVPIRLVISGYAMLLFFLVKDRKETFRVWGTKKNTLDLVIYSFMGMTMCQYMYFSTVEYSNAGTATVIQYLAPVIILGLVCLKQKKPPKAMEVTAMVCALIGIFLIATHGDIHHMVISKAALFYGLITAFTVVIYNLQPRNLLQQFNPSLLVAWAMAIGGTSIFILLKPWQYSPIIDSETLLAMTVIIVLGTILSFSFYMQGVKLIGATHASLYASVEPLTAAILSFVWLKVPFQALDFTGFFFIISTIFLLSFRAKPKPVPKAHAKKGYMPG